MGTWTNDDGLHIKYGTSEGESTSHAGQYRDAVAGENVVELTLELADLSASETIMNDVFVLPANAWITKVEVKTLEAAVGGTTVDVGLIDQDRSTEIDYDGLVAALATASINAVGEVNTWQNGDAGAGALVGGELTNAGYLSASAAGTYTAGILKVKVWYVSRGVDRPNTY